MVGHLLKERVLGLLPNNLPLFFLICQLSQVLQGFGNLFPWRIDSWTILPLLGRVIHDGVDEAEEGTQWRFACVALRGVRILVFMTVRVSKKDAERQ